jgi:glutaredoxin-related protein
MQKRKRKCCGLGNKTTSMEVLIYLSGISKYNTCQFKNYQDTILLVDKGEKQVSSTLGHDLMHNHPLKDALRKHMKTWTN